MELGALSVTTTGALTTLLWSVENWAMLEPQLHLIMEPLALEVDR